MFTNQLVIGMTIYETLLLVCSIVVIVLLVINLFRFSKLKKMKNASSEVSDVCCEVSDNQVIYYFACMGLKPKNVRVYTNAVVAVDGSYPTETDIERVRQGVLARNMEFKDCVILSFNRLNK